MRSLLAVILVWQIAFVVNAAELPPEHEAARLNLALERSIQIKDWKKANELLLELRAIKTEQPIKSFYYEGLVLLELGHPEKAQEVLTQYVILSGEKGEFYASALEAITVSKSMLSEKKAPSSTKSQISHAESTQEGGNGYIKSLKALYMVETAEEALIMQVNSLLAAHPYIGNRVKKKNNKKGVRYKLSVENHQLVIQEKDYQSGVPVLKASVRSILGVDPFIGHGCSSEDLKCWLSDPVDKHKHWLLIGYDELIAAELANALSKLIIELQR